MNKVFKCIVRADDTQNVRKYNLKPSLENTIKEIETKFLEGENKEYNTYFMKSSDTFKGEYTQEFIKGLELYNQNLQFKDVKDYEREEEMGINRRTNQEIVIKESRIYNLFLISEEKIKELLN